LVYVYQRNMNVISKKRVVKDYDTLPEEILSQLKLNYPSGFSDNLEMFSNKKGKYMSALPFETDDIYYLVRMTVVEAEQIIEDDNDYDHDGNLKDEFIDAMEEDEG
jgi:DNA-directed RNA polymerase subunit delta